jgi:hypothetical protein
VLGRGAAQGRTLRHRRLGPPVRDRPPRHVGHCRPPRRRPGPAHAHRALCHRRVTDQRTSQVEMTGSSRRGRCCTPESRKRLGCRRRPWLGCASSILGCVLSLRRKQTRRLDLVAHVCRSTFISSHTSRGSSRSALGSRGRRPPRSACKPIFSYNADQEYTMGLYSNAVHSRMHRLCACEDQASESEKKECWSMDGKNTFIAPGSES